MRRIFDTPLMQQKARQYLEHQAWRWQQERGYTGLDTEVRIEPVNTQGLAAIRVTVYQYGSKALLDSQLFELALDVQRTPLIPTQEAA